MAKKCFVIHKEGIVVFHNQFYIPRGYFSFHLVHVRLLGSMERGKTRNNCFVVYAIKNKLKLEKDYAEKFSKITGIEIYSQHCSENMLSSMEIIAVNNFENSVDTGKNKTK